MIDEYGAFGGILVGTGKKILLAKPVSVPLSQQKFHIDCPAIESGSTWFLGRQLTA
jgi:hypothetical protein